MIFRLVSLDALLYFQCTHLRMASLQREEAGENPARSRHCECAQRGFQALKQGYESHSMHASQTPAAAFL
ncbi:hypothetical protein ASG35_19420 [Burkholderia sp. Leaf177]|nr:hypothetical protein ASG35_19420 [Burkholderia sp. Leaf177]